MATVDVGLARSIATLPPVPEGLAIVMKGYPRLSETFIAQELLGLQRKGIPFTIYALREPTDGRVHPVHDAITAPVRYLPEYLYRAPMRVIGAALRLRRRTALQAGLAKAFRAWLRDLRRDPTPNRIRRWGQALVLADELPSETRHIYVHFLHTPASVARYAAIIRGVTWSTSAHAKDIYTIPDWEKSEKLAEMEWLVTCTAANVVHLKGIAGGHADKVQLLYHGLDFDRFQPPQFRAESRDGSDPEQPVRLLSVGRAVAKKGYDVLLKALAALPPNLAWHLTHIGGGELKSSLQMQAVKLGLGDRIEWRGALAQNEVLEAYRAADLFVLASKIADDGDRDGLPNVLMEAQSQGLACVSTVVSGVPELIIDGVTGCLVPPGDSSALATAIEHLIQDPAGRRRLGDAGHTRVRQSFRHELGIDRLADRLRQHLNAPAIATRS